MPSVENGAEEDSTRNLVEGRREARWQEVGDSVSLSLPTPSPTNRLLVSQTTGRD